jgi:two-component system CheB/CheR fusion protein
MTARDLKSRGGPAGRTSPGRTRSPRARSVRKPVAHASFPIVGVGASAGGLEAFTQLLSVLPAGIGMAFVLVQHLDPEHESALAQILSRATPLPVCTITDGCRVLPDHIYVIPRATHLTIVDGTLRLRKRQRAPSPHRPIDAFFESLAVDCHERAVGVVLSGTASDGTLGLEAIKAEGGITFAQDGSAKHDSMPRSAVAAGCVDLVLSPAGIAEELVRISKHPLVLAAPRPRPTDPAAGTEPGSEQSRDAYTRILTLLRNHSGVEFALYKSSTILRRIHRRLVLNRCSTLDDYAGFLRGNSRELAALYSDVLISVTSFFRNAETFELLQNRVFPELLDQRDDDAVRCWVLGCSTGQEAYSIAISFLEATEKAARSRRLQVFATDLNEAVLEKARHGLYAKTLAADVSPDRLAKFFVEEDGGYRVSKAVRELVVFARQDVISDPPFSRMNFISCRNVLIYFEPALQKKVIPTFHYALKPGGYLLLGASESIAGFTDLFAPADKKHKVYVRKNSQPLVPRLPLGRLPGEKATPARASAVSPRANRSNAADGRGELDAQRQADHITINQFAPPGVLVNADLQVLQFRGPTGTYLQPPVGRASFDLLKMAREGLMLPLRSAINQAKKDGKPACKKDVHFEAHGTTRTVSIHVVPLKAAGERSFLILFEDGGGTGTHPEPRSTPALRASRVPASAVSTRIAALEGELDGLREYTRSIQEHHESTTEELQAANEEVQSANEELQSVNEELETSKEELESTNEELTTLNEEMANRNRDLTLLNNDMVNVQTSAKLAILLLARDLTIRRFSPQAQKLFDLADADVGRSIKDVRHDLLHGDGAGSVLDVGRLAATVIADLREEEREVRNKHGHWFSLRVRPYTTLDGKVDGAVVVLSDIDTLKRSEQVGLENEARFRALFDTSPVAVYSCDRDGVIQDFNQHAVDLWGRAPAAGETRERFCGSHKMFRTDGRPMPHAECPMAAVVSGQLFLRHHRAQARGGGDRPPRGHRRFFRRRDREQEPPGHHPELESGRAAALRIHRGGSHRQKGDPSDASGSRQ